MGITDWFSIGKNKRIKEDESVEEQLAEVSGEEAVFPAGGVNYRMLSSVRDAILSREDCDEISGSKGEFGRDPNNPIPVNGILGEVKYLARLSCNCDHGILFHRLGSIPVTRAKGSISVDVFETVCVNGKHWDILYLDMYHPRRSRKLPAGYGALPYVPEFTKAALAFGTTKRVGDFPQGLPPYVTMHSGIKSLGAKCKAMVEAAAFSRPPKHLQVLAEIKPAIEKMDDLSEFLSQAWDAVRKGLPVEALENYSAAFDVLTREASNHAHAADGTVRDEKETRTLLPKYLEVVREYYRQNDAACKISYNMGVLFAEVGDNESARRMFEQSIELTPEGLDYPDPKIGLKGLE